MLQFQKTSGQELRTKTNSDEGSDEYSADPERKRAESNPGRTDRTNSARRRQRK